ncbi:MAG: DUF507 family protein [Deltaproteobacteria bacterium]|nr:DUF507 family protein [Deltaproteobacteria bacterium]
MKFSDDRISHMAHLVQQGLIREAWAAAEDESKVLYEVKRAMIDFWKVEDEADQAARNKIATLKRGVDEGSREWEILYQKYLEEELNKRGRGH